MIDEIWKDIDGYEGLYQVSNYGQVISLVDRHGRARIRVLQQQKHRCGYLLAFLCKDGKMKGFVVHRLVATAFLPNPDGLPEVNHIDEDKTNNCVWNLEWCNRNYNVNYGTGIERRSKRVYQYTKDGSFVRSYPSAAEAERQTGIDNIRISAVARGDYGCKSAGGYMWSYIPPKSTITNTLF